MQKAQVNLFYYSDNIGGNTGGRYYTTYKGNPIYSFDYLLDAIKDAAGAELANMVQAYFADVQHQANEQIADAQEDTKEVQEDLEYLTTNYNIIFNALKDASEQLSDALYNNKHLSRTKVDKVEKELTDIYYTLRED